MDFAYVFSSNGHTGVVTKPTIEQLDKLVELGYLRGFLAVITSNPAKEAA